MPALIAIVVIVFVMMSLVEQYPWLWAIPVLLVVYGFVAVAVGEMQEMRREREAARRERERLVRHERDRARMVEEDLAKAADWFLRRIGQRHDN